MSDMDMFSFGQLIPTLNGENWISYNRRLRSELASRSLLGVVLGNDLPVLGENDEAARARRQRAGKALAIIMRSCSDSVLAIIPEQNVEENQSIVDYVRQVYSTLAEQFSQPREEEAFDLRLKLDNRRGKHDESVASICTRFQGICESLAAAGHIVPEHDKARFSLRALPDR